MHPSSITNDILPERQSLSTKPPPVNIHLAGKTKCFIKNMVSLRCIIVVKGVLENLGLNYSKVELGEVEIIGSISAAMHDQLKSDLLEFDLELIEDRKIILVEKIKNAIVELIHYEEDWPTVKFSVYLREKLNNAFTYTYLSTLFKEAVGTTIEHYIITHRIERAKEMIAYNTDQTISEIAWKLHFSSVAHLSYQFKLITGLTPTDFKNMQHKELTPLECL